MCSDSVHEVARLVEFLVRRIIVENASMLPDFVPGERVTAMRRWRHVRPGDVVVLRDPRDAHHWLLKRCVSRVGTRLDVRGDNAGPSTDSRAFGLVEEASVSWIVLSKRSSAGPHSLTES